MRWSQRLFGSFAVLLVLHAFPACTTSTPTAPVQAGPADIKPPGAFPIDLPPAVAAPTPAPTTQEYRLGVGDIIEISLFRQDRDADDLRRQMPIRPDGKISYFFVGDLEARGRTTDELRVELKDRLSKYIRSPEVAVILIEPGKKRVYVVGEVNEQGVRELKTGHADSLLDTIFLSKGLTKRANVEVAYIIRSNAVIPVPLAALLFKGDRSKDVILQSEDVVYVPEVLEQRIFVLGYVKRPGAYEISRPIRLTEAIALGEDFALGAKRDAVKIIRGGLPKGPQPPEIVTVDMGAIREGVREDVYVHRGDIVLTPATALGKWNEILNQLIPSLQTLFITSVVASQRP